MGNEYIFLNETNEEYNNLHTTQVFFCIENIPKIPVGM